MFGGICSSAPDEFKSAWSLTADGALATETTFPDFQGGGPPITLKATYKKS